MRKRLLASLFLACWPLAAAAVDAPVPTSPADVSVVVDQVTGTGLSAQVVKTQGILAWTVSAHDDQYSYTYPLCADASLVESDGRAITDPSGLGKGDSLTVGVRPNAATPAGACITRIVRQHQNRGASHDDCLQGFQVFHEVDGDTAHLVTDHQYTYTMNVYNRPTLDCDRQFYGKNPITSTIAPNQRFVVSLLRGTTVVKSWSLTTDSAGVMSLGYVFQSPSQDYRFEVKPDGSATAGDVIRWSSPVADAHPAAATTPKAPAATGSAAPIVVVVVLLVAGSAGFFYWRRRPRKPKDEEGLPDKEEPRYKHIKPL
jgi:hypothetical protein